MSLKPVDVHGVIAWYSSLTPHERAKVFHAILERVLADPMDALSDYMAYRLNTRPISTFEDQLYVFSHNFSGWNDNQRNVLLNELETVDLPRVYEFYERFRSLRHV